MRNSFDQNHEQEAEREENEKKKMFSNKELTLLFFTRMIGIGFLYQPVEWNLLGYWYIGLMLFNTIITAYSCFLTLKLRCIHKYNNSYQDIAY